MTNTFRTSITRTLRDYAARVRTFRPNARLYLVSVIVSGLSMGVFRLLFNFYVLSLGFDEALLGRLITTSSLTALLVALPVGYLADLMGRKRSLLSGGILTSFAILGMVVFPPESAFYGLHVIMGFSQSLWAITMSPFLVENSGEAERTYLFSFGFGLQMLSGFVGNWLGGYLPGWIGTWQDVSATDSLAYGWSMAAVAAMFALGIIPLLFLHRNRLESDARSVFAPIEYAAKYPKLLGKLILLVIWLFICTG